MGKGSVPQWDQTLALLVRDPASESVGIWVRGRRSVLGKVELGFETFAVASIADGSFNEGTLRVEKMGGSIRISFVYVTLPDVSQALMKTPALPDKVNKDAAISEKLERAPAEPALKRLTSPGGVLMIRVHEGKSLLAMDNDGLSDPFAVVNLVDVRGKRQVIKTAAVRNSLAPVWDTQKEVLLRDYRTSRINIAVSDFDDVSDHDLIGSAYIDIRSFLEGKNSFEIAPGCYAVERVWISLDYEVRQGKLKVDRYGRSITTSGFVSISLVFRPCNVTYDEGSSSDVAREQAGDNLEKSAVSSGISQLGKIGVGGARAFVSGMSSMTGTVTGAKKKAALGAGNGGSLRCKVIGARNLEAKDKNGLSDPFCVVKLGGKTVHKTPVVKESLNPSWNTEFEAAVIDRFRERVLFIVKDKDPLGSDRIGRCSLALSDSTVLTGEPKWFPLDGAESGEICVAITMMADANDALLTMSCAATEEDIRRIELERSAIPDPSLRKTTGIADAPVALATGTVKAVAATGSAVIQGGAAVGSAVVLGSANAVSTGANVLASGASTIAGGIVGGGTAFLSGANDLRKRATTLPASMVGRGSSKGLDVPAADENDGKAKGKSDGGKSPAKGDKDKDKDKGKQRADESDQLSKARTLSVSASTTAKPDDAQGGHARTLSEGGGSVSSRAPDTDDDGSIGKVSQSSMRNAKDKKYIRVVLRIHGARNLPEGKDKALVKVGGWSSKSLKTKKVALGKGAVDWNESLDFGRTSYKPNADIVAQVRISHGPFGRTDVVEFRVHLPADVTTEGYSAQLWCQAAATTQGASSPQLQLTIDVRPEPDA
eukprot:Opistho-2@3324